MEDQGATFLQQHQSSVFVPLAQGPIVSASAALQVAPIAHAVGPQPTAFTGRHARLQAAVACPFTGCPGSRKQMSKEALVSHLSARHVVSGQMVPAGVLAMLKHQACVQDLVPRGQSLSM